MGKEETIAQLEKANTELREQVTQKDRQIADLEAQLRSALGRIEELEGRLNKDSHNSSKPPSSDGLKRGPRGRGKKSERSSGGQLGHSGSTRGLVATPERVVVHRRERCQSCQHDLSQIAGSVGERRQVHDLPALQLRVEEHQIEEVRCPVCGEMNRGSFPEDVNAPVQYGPRVQALCVYLSQFQLLPMERTCEMIADLCHCTLGEGTLANWIQEASKRLEPTIEQIKALLVKSLLNHTDETGIRIKGRLHWGHVSGTRWLTHYAWHRKRGKEAMDSIGILPAFKGRVMHDRWRSYDQYGSAHSLCGSHLLRDCLAVFEQEQQTWAQDMHDLLLMMVKATDYWREQGAKALPQSERNVWLALYFHILAMGYAKHPPPETQQLPQQKGKRKQSASKNLLDALLHRADQVLAFLDDLSLPFTNNLAERDLRMLKVQQKISGTFRSQEGATAFFNIRSYLSTMRKQGRSMLDAMMAVFSGTPFPVAWAGPE